jgi:hypothetical protein
MEYNVSTPKAVRTHTTPPPPPPLKIASINVKSILSSTDKHQEIVAISVVHALSRVDVPRDTSRWQSGKDLKVLSVICTPHGSAYRSAASRKGVARSIMEWAGKYFCVLRRRS